MLWTTVVSNLPNTHDQFRWNHLIFPWETIPMPPCWLEEVLSQHTITLTKVWAWDQLSHPDSPRIQILEGGNWNEHSLPLKLTAHYAHTEPPEPPVSSLLRTGSSVFHQFCEHSMSFRYIFCLLNVSQSKFHVYNQVTLTSTPGHLWFLKLCRSLGCGVELRSTSHLCIRLCAKALHTCSPSSLTKIQ